MSSVNCFIPDHQSMWLFFLIPLFHWLVPRVWGGGVLRVDILASLLMLGESLQVFTVRYYISCGFFVIALNQGEEVPSFPGLWSFYELLLGFVKCFFRLFFFFLSLFLSCIEIFMWLFSFGLLIPLIDFWILNQFCISRITSSILLWYIFPFTYC